MAMIEAYKIGVSFVLGGNLSAGIEALIPAFEALDEHITHAQGEAKGLAAELRGVGGSAAGIGRAADNMARLAEAMATMNRAVGNWNAGGGIPDFVIPRAPSTPHGGGQSTPAGNARSGAPPSNEAIPYTPNFTMLSNGALVPYTGPERGWEPRGLVPHYQPNFTLPNGAGHDAPFFGEGEHGPPIPLNPNGRRGGSERGDGGGRGHVPGAFDGVIPALMTGELIKNIFGASFDVGAKEAELLTNGWTPEQVSKARALAQAIQVSTPGATIGGGLEVMKDIGVIFRNRDGLPDVGTAIDAAPSMLKDALVLAARGHGDALTEVFQAVQAGDLKGAASKPGTDETDPARLAQFVHNEMLATVLTGGRVTPRMILQNARMGGAAAAMMSDEEFFGGNLALIEGLGPQAASALQGFNRQFGSGRMGKGTIQELEQMFPTLHGHWHETGMGQVVIDNEAMGKIDYLAQHPLSYVHDELLPRIDKKLRGDHPDFDTWDAQKRLVYESQEGSRISTTVTGSRFLTEIFRMWPQLMREKAGFDALRSSDPYQTQLANNPQMQAKGLGAAWNAFEVSLGEAGQGPAIEALNGITTWLNSIAAWAKTNPDGSKAALEGLAFGILALGAEKVVGALAALGGNGKGGLFMLAGGILALSGAVDKFPEWLQNAAKGAVAGGTVAGVPGAIAGGVGGGLWNMNPLGLNDVTPGDAVRGLGHLLHLNAYHPQTDQPGPVIEHITYLHLDDREIARAVTRQQLRMMGGQVSGTLRPDPSLAPQYGAHLVET